MGKELRREPRVRTDFEISLESAGVSRQFTTRNASFRGMFVVSDDPYPLRRLVRVTIERDDHSIELMGVVAHTVNAADAREAGKVPGMGISLFGLGPNERDRWQEFVRSEYDRDPEARAALEAAELPRLRIHLKDDAMKDRFFGHDFPSGQIFYRTSDLLPVGTRVVCEVRHHQSGSGIELQGVVVEVVEGSRRKRGIRIAFDELSEASTDRFGRFERGELSEAAVVDDEAGEEE